jgi:hypothetical protein
MTTAQVARRVAAVVVAIAAASAWAGPPQTVYRCGPDGRQYSQTPCADGRAVTTEDSRSAEQQRAARDVAAKDARQADKLAAERREREAAAKGQTAAGVKNSNVATGSDAAASAPKVKGKSKAKVQDPNMSPVMRAAPGSTTTK